MARARVRKEVRCTFDCFNVPLTTRGQDNASRGQDTASWHACRGFGHLEVDAQGRRQNVCKDFHVKVVVRRRLAVRLS